MFYSELKDLEKEFKGRLSIQWIFSQANIKGVFLDVLTPVCQKCLKYLEKNVNKFFICGPEK